jgi:hypothetical protein
MIWEKSRALTPLKRDFLRRFCEQNEAFFLTGGSALGISCLDHRLSCAMDSCTRDASAVNWRLLENRISAVAIAIAASPEFCRVAADDGRARAVW